MPTFQRHVYSIRIRTGRFFNTDRLILFIAMQWTHFQSWQMGKRYETSLQTLYRFFKKLCVAKQTFQCQIYSIRLRTGRFFNIDRLILFIAMQWTHLQSWQRGKSYEISLQTFYRFFEKLCVAMQTFQRQIYSILIRTERFFNTDRLILFIAMQWTHFQSWQMGKKLWNIVKKKLWSIKVEKWGKSYEISLKLTV